jgi:hypothetical protein
MESVFTMMDGRLLGKHFSRKDTIDPEGNYRLFAADDGFSF